MMLRQGDKGNAVAVVQFALNQLTAFIPKLKTDGIFGWKTDQRVRQFQQQKKLLPDGIVGPNTLDNLFTIVQLTAKTRFRQNEKAASRAGAFGVVQNGGSFIPPFVPPRPSLSLPNVQPAGLAEFLRQQNAFWNWWAQPQPKPAVPQLQAVIVPTPGPWGPVYLPVQHTVIPLPGPPAKSASASVPVEPEGGGFTLQIVADASVDVAKVKFKEATYGIDLSWVALKRPNFEVETSVAVERNHEGEISAETEVTVTGNSGLSLKKKLGEIGVLKAVPYLATAITSELAWQASGGLKAYAEIDITKVGPFKLRAEVGVKGGPKLSYGPEKLPDGREEHKLTAVPFGATGFVGIGGEF